MDKDDSETYDHGILGRQIGSLPASDEPYVQKSVEQHDQDGTDKADQSGKMFRIGP